MKILLAHLELAITIPLPMPLWELMCTLQIVPCLWSDDHDMHTAAFQGFVTSYPHATSNHKFPFKVKML